MRRQGNEITGDGMSVQMEEMQALIQKINAHIMLIKVSDEMEPIYVSPGFCSFTGMASGDSLHRKSFFASFIHPDDREHLSNFLRNAAVKNCSGEYTCRVLLSEERVKWWQVYAVPMTHGEEEPPTVMVMMTDVTNPRESSDVLKSIVEHCPVGIAVFEGKRHLRPVYANEMLLHMIDCTEGRFYSKRGNDILSFVAPEDLDKVKKALEYALESRQPYEITHRVAGRDCFLKVRGFRLPSASDKLLFVVICTDVTSQKASHQQLERSYENMASSFEQQRMKFLFENSSLETYEVDIVEKTMLCSRETQLKYGFDSGRYENMPESIIEFGTIHNDSIEAYRNFYKKIFAGQPETTCVVRVRNADGIYELLRLVCKTFFNEEGKPIRSVGLSQRVEQYGETKLSFDQEDKLFELMQGKYCCIAKVNISQNRIESMDHPGYMSGEKMDLNYEEYLMDAFISRAIKDSRENLFSDLCTKRIGEVFKEGKRWLSSQFKVILEDGNIYWLMYHAHLLISPYNGDLYMFVCLRFYDKAKKLELMLEQKPTYFPDSPFYDEQTLRKVVDLLCAQSAGKGLYCGMAVICVSNWYEMEKKFCDKDFSRVNTALQRKLALYIGQDCVIGQLSKDEFAIFSPEEASSKDFVQKINKLLIAMNSPNFMTVPMEHMLEFVVGISNSRNTGLGYDGLLHAALKMKKKASLFHPLQSSVIEEGDRQEDKAYFAPVKDVDQDNMFESNPKVSIFLQKCAHLFVNSIIPCSEMNRVLKRLGKYFMADRAYLLEMQNEGLLNNTYEWCEEGIVPEIENLQRIPIREMPTFLRSLQSKNMFIMNDVSASSASEYEQNILVSQGIRRLIVFPLINKNSVFGFIGIDNPRRFDDVALVLNTLASMIVSELVKGEFLKKEIALREVDLVSQAKSRNVLNEHLRKINPEILSSAGAFIVKIMGLEHINTKNGIQYGDEILRSLSTALKADFGEEGVYRYGNSTLLALPQDISSSTFYEKCEALSHRFNRFIPCQIAFGYSWSDRLIQMTTLISNANLLMLADKREKENGGDGRISRSKNDLQSMLLQAIGCNNAFIYLQPKVLAKTGEVCGAEALIRMRNKDGGMESPGRFIPILEEFGLIRHVDRFVLKKTVECLAKWKEEGRTLIPVSLNFSRQTLIEPDVMQYVCDICKEYGVERSLIQIEITETLGDIETESISLIAHKFADNGICLALDDFGAKYSNLSILSVVPFTTLKLDKAMVDSIVSNPKMLAISKTVIRMCHEVGMAIVAEGVEEKEQFDLLEKIHCDEIQGYYVNKPLPVEDFTALYL